MNNKGITFVLTLFILSTGCGDRIQVPHSINVVLGLPGIKAVSAIEAELDPETLADLGGSLPPQWPENVQPVSILAPVDVAMLVEREELNVVGRDLAKAANNEFEIRLRRIHWEYDPIGINHPIVDFELWAAPQGPGSPEASDTYIIGFAGSTEADSGDLLFAPGGRKNLMDLLMEESFMLTVRGLMLFDPSIQPERPDEYARISLSIKIDILK